MWPALRGGLYLFVHPLGENTLYNFPILGNKTGKNSVNVDFQVTVATSDELSGYPSFFSGGKSLDTA